MLRKIIKKIIPSKSEVFYTLLVSASQNSHESADILANIIDNKDPEILKKMTLELNARHSMMIEINKQIIQQLNLQFITPMDRGDIHSLASLFLKLTRRVLKTNKKLQLYDIDVNHDDCLIGSVNTLQAITECLFLLLSALKDDDNELLLLENEKIILLDEAIIQDVVDGWRAMKKANLPMDKLFELKDVYKSIESAVEICGTIAQTVMRIHITEI